MKSRGVKTRNGLIVMLLLTAFLFGCGKESAADNATLDGEEAEEQVIDVQKLHEANSDIFAWIKIPGTTIEAPVLQSSEGDDSYYASHDYVKRYDPDGALYIEAANGNDMCDFNTVIHGSSPSDGSRFAGLSQFLDRTYFDENQFIYIYLDGNALGIINCCILALLGCFYRLESLNDFLCRWFCILNREVNYHHTDIAVCELILKFLFNLSLDLAFGSSNNIINCVINHSISDAGKCHILHNNFRIGRIRVEFYSTPSSPR